MTGRRIAALLLIVAAALLLAALQWWSKGGLEAEGGSAPVPAAAEPAEAQPEPAPLPPADVVAPTPTETPEEDGAAAPEPEDPHPDEDRNIGPEALGAGPSGTLRITTQFDGVQRPGRIMLLACPHDPAVGSMVLEANRPEHVLSPGTYTVRLLASGVALGPHDSEVEIVAGETRELHIAIPNPKTLTIELVDPEGKPAPDVKVRLDIEYGHIPARSSVTGEGMGVAGGMAGSFTGRSKYQRVTGWGVSETGAHWGITPAIGGIVTVGDTGAYPVTVRVALAGAVLHEEVIPAGTRRHRIVVDPPPAPLTLTVPDTAGLRGGWRAQIVQGTRTRWNVRVHGARREFRNLGPGDYVAMVSGGHPQQYWLARVTLTGAPQVLEVQPAPAATVTAEFVDAKTRRPVAPVVVACRFETAVIATRWDQRGTGDGGVHRLAVPGGVPLELTLRSTGYADETRAVQVKPGDTHALGVIALRPQK